MPPGSKKEAAIKRTKEEDVQKAGLKAKRASDAVVRKATLTGTRAASTATSESDETDEDDGGGRGLKSLNGLQRTPQKVQRPRERRQIKLLDSPRTSRDAVIVSRNKERDEAHRMAMRLKPDISSLHRSILSWDYGHPGNDPPIKHRLNNLDKVPDDFQDYTKYHQIFEPLLMHECWSQLVQSKEDRTIDVYDCRILARHFVDYYLDLDLSISGSVKKDWFLSDTDIILLHQNDHCHILGKVISYRTNPTDIQAEIRCFLDRGRQDPGLHVNSSWKIKKIFRYLNHLNHA